MPVSFLLRYLGGSRESAGGSTAGSETEAVRRIAARLDQLPPERARFLAAFAYVLARVANADLRISETESDAMADAIASVAGLDTAETALAVEIAKSQAKLLGGTENYVVTREFRRLSEPEERLRLVDCLWAVAAADGAISADEDAEIGRIGEELGLLRQDVLALRAPWRERLRTG